MFFAASKVLWFLATPSNALAGAVALGLLAGSIGFGRLGLRLAAIGCAALLTVGFGPVGDWALIPLEGRFAAFADDGRPVDGIIVLGGAVNAGITIARDQISTGDAGERVIALADLARRYPTARLVYSGGSGNLLVPDVAAESDAVARHAGTLGLAPGRILVENRSRTTWENAVETRALVQPGAGERWLLVTSAWHMPRAVGCFRRAGFPVTPYPVDYLTRGPADAWAVHATVSAGLERADLALKEWAGLAVYWLSGRTDALFPS